MTQPWYPFYWSDYSGKTMHLTMGQHGAYMLLLRWIYTTGRPIPDKQRFSIARASLEQECSDVDFVLSEFFTLTDGMWSNDRALEVIETTQNKHQRRVIAGKKGGDRKASNAKAMLEQYSTNQNHNHIDNTDVLSTPLPPRGRSGYPPDFETFWQTYPNRTGKAAALKAYQSALKQHGVTHAILVDRAGHFAAAHAAARTPGQYIPHPATWLNQGRWEDDLSRITARQGAAQPAPNARGSQFNALQSALSELMQESGGDADPQHRPMLSETESRPSDRLPPAGWSGAGLPRVADRTDTARSQTIDHDPAGPNDG